MLEFEQLRGIILAALFEKETRKEKMLFKNITILDENFKIRENMYVGIRADRIEYVSETEPKTDFVEVYDGKNRLMMPGFYNTHAHSPMCLMRGYGENMNLQDWLFKRIFPFEDKLTGNAVYWSTLLTMAESLKFGIVSTSDMYYFLDDMVRAVAESGAKNNISRGITNPMGEPIDQLASIPEMIDAAKYNGYADGRIVIDASLHAEYTSNPETARKVAELAKGLGLRMQVHVSETKSEHEECKARRNGMTPVQYLAECGILDVPATCAHCVWIEGDDYRILKEKGATVATNPVSNLKLASGICDVNELIKNGINVGIGTDSVASNNNLSFFEEMKTMGLLAKVKHMDPTLITPEQTLYMATRGGALSQGREDCGYIGEGAKADFILLRTDTPNMNPVHNMLNNIVLSATDADIVMTAVDGKILYKDGEFTTIDIEKTVSEVDKAAKDILARL